MNDMMTLSQRADALEEKMSQELDYIVIKSRLYSAWPRAIWARRRMPAR